MRRALWLLFVPTVLAGCSTRVDLGYTPTGEGDAGQGDAGLCASDAAVSMCERPTGFGCATATATVSSCDGLLISGDTTGLSDDFAPAALDSDCTDPPGRPDYVLAVRICEDGLYEVRDRSPVGTTRIWTRALESCTYPTDGFFCLGSFHANNSTIGISAGRTLLIMVESGDGGPFDLSVEFVESI